MSFPHSFLTALCHTTLLILLYTSCKAPLSSPSSPLSSPSSAPSSAPLSPTISDNASATVKQNGTRVISKGQIIVSATIAHVATVVRLNTFAEQYNKTMKDFKRVSCPEIERIQKKIQDNTPVSEQLQAVHLLPERDDHNDHDAHCIYTRMDMTWPIDDRWFVEYQTMNSSDTVSEIHGTMIIGSLLHFSRQITITAIDPNTTQLKIHTETDFGITLPDAVVSYFGKNEMETSLKTIADLAAALQINARKK